jgi:oxygen-dependent protoporphyrinogen oxidase
VIGGGITGLAAAHRVTELSRERGIAIDLTLVESRARLGGTIATERREGFLIEAGADSFLSDRPWALALCRRLRLSSLLVGADPRFRKTFVWRGGRLHPLPDGFQLLAPSQLMPLVCSDLFSWRGKLRMALDMVLPRRRATDDESLADFIRRRLGREALERAVEPLIGAIYGASATELSMAALLPRFRELERRDRSLILGLWRASRLARTGVGATATARSAFVTFRNGMTDFVEALASRLPGGAVRLGRRVRAVVRNGNGWRVINDGEVEHVDRVVVATEAYAAAALLSTVDAALGADLAAIPYAASATVTLGYRRRDAEHPLDGFGFVVPAPAGMTVAACTFSSVKYPERAPAGHVLLRAFPGQNAIDVDDATLVHAVRRDVHETLGIAAEPVLTRVHRHASAMPRYTVGHLGKIEVIDARVNGLPGLALAGSGYRGSGVADCVRSGEMAAERVVIGSSLN